MVRDERSTSSFGLVGGRVSAPIAALSGSQPKGVDGDTYLRFRHFTECGGDQLAKSPWQHSFSCRSAI
jgi:hypothetical protein